MPRKKKRQADKPRGETFIGFPPRFGPTKKEKEEKLRKKHKNREE